MMAAFRFSILKSVFAASRIRSVGSSNSYTRSPKFTVPIFARPLDVNETRKYNRNESCWWGNRADTQFRMLSVESILDIRHYRTESVVASSPKCLQNKSLLSLHSQNTVFPVCASTFSNLRTYSSYFGGKGEAPRNSEVSVGSVANDSNSKTTDMVGGDWVDGIKHAWQSTVDAMAFTGQKAREASDELTPYVQQLLDSHPYLRNVLIPVSSTLTATILAWLVLPRILRKFHAYTMKSSVLLLAGNLSEEQIPYEKSFWGALEDPVRYLFTFMAFSQLGVMIAPHTFATQYIAQAWRGALIISFVWFLYRWKTIVVSRSLAVQHIAGLDREKLLALDKVSSVGLFVLGLMALAEACGVAVHSILTVGGIGGVATAFAARDILGNVLSGLSMQFTKPFSLGDTIKAGSIEGQVVEMGLTTTSLLNAEKFPIVVPNSLFSSQVIVNKSRAHWRAMVTMIPLRIDNLEMIPQISEDIKSMLRSNSKIFLEKEAPYCFLSRIGNSYAELTVGCNIKHMSKEELYSTQQDILLQSIRIIKQHGAALGGTLQDWSNQ
ncbi:PREDICTED: mechanosensitive ion channel protein 1, mitochondrial isoform X1 [Nelumbo nucifera]|uniref:Mechanosensitive ion channel protein 1, mitochondrial isoform X1 n=1 Tax=Nelumbo nucifera TaxID=4432 RepID=A0A1U8B7B3_NELNU|nr:PREDICTED: mechanosensitive ion channel protein 1, mitochondrial isoform X1 [Nelumbo nucifera]XP_010276909.1 PREDICTED: mechanosensitive ion channel protein 1, mitochondrial isoform X1 [Nelumbo nucifera]